jgi:hypothetical protein
LPVAARVYRAELELGGWAFSNITLNVVADARVELVVGYFGGSTSSMRSSATFMPASTRRCRGTA